ncbi:MAG: TIGR02186 family protein [Devosia sp.]
MRSAVLTAVTTMLLVTPVAAEKLASTVSTPNVQITSSFDGAVLSMFGSIEADDPAVALMGPYNVIVVVTGPLQTRVARLKTNSFGIWTNTDQVTFKAFPSFYAVISSGKFENIADATLLADEAVLPEVQAAQTSQTGGPKGMQFGEELVRLMTDQGHFSVKEGSIQFLSPTAYVAQVTLPSDVANGAFLTHTLVLKDRQLVAERTEGFSVRKTGFENFVFVASRQQPLLYGIICVILALGTGWLAGVVFRR